MFGVFASCWVVLVVLTLFSYSSCCYSALKLDPVSLVSSVLYFSIMILSSFFFSSLANKVMHRFAHKCADECVFIILLWDEFLSYQSSYDLIFIFSKKGLTKNKCVLGNQFKQIQ